MRVTNFVLSAVIAAASFAAPAFADMSTPTGDVILSINGDTGQAAPVQLDLAMLEDLPAVTFETTTIWTDGSDSYTGVSLHQLLGDFGVQSGTLTMTALNDYAVQVPVSDAVPGGPILAYARNGEAMSVRDKGPIWLIYPFDDNEAYKSEEFYSRSIWQLDRITIEQ